MIDELVQQGFTRKEAELYLALIRYGSSSAASIGHRVNINRTLVYPLLENLVKKGFVEKLMRNNRMIYAPLNPQILVQKAKTQLDQAEFLTKNLNTMKLVTSQPIVRTFQGLEGIQQMTDIFLEEAKETKKEMLQMGQEIQFVLKYPRLIEDFIQKRVKYKIPLKLLCNRFKYFDQFLNEKRDKKEQREVKLVKTEELNVDCTTYIYGNSIAVISLADEMQGYILQSKNIADLHRKLFYLLWSKIK